MSANDGFDPLVAVTDPALVVVTTAVADERAGCLVGFHAQSSIEPRRYAVWLSRVNHTFGVALRASHLAVHFLTDGDRELAELFGAETGDDVDKFARTPWTPGPGGVPLLDACPHRLAGRRVTLVDDGGDHVGVVLDPVQADSPGPFTPLRMGAVAGMRAGHEVGGQAAGSLRGMIAVHDVPERSRYEATVDGELAGHADYQDQGDVRVFVHTEVADAYEGRGVGSTLAREALDDVRASGRTLVARCPFIRAYIERHPDYADLVSSPGSRPRG